MVEHLALGLKVAKPSFHPKPIEAISTTTMSLLGPTIRRMIEDVLFTEWKKGGPLSTKLQEAKLVTYDRSTMTQNDLDAGRLVCLIVVALL